MRVLFWIPYPTEGASNRYRVEQYLPYLKRAGIDYSMRPFWNSSAFKVLYKRRHRFSKLCYFILGTFSRIFDLVRIFQYNVVFIHREAYPIGGAFLENILRILRKPFIFDFDDAIFLPTSSRPNNFIEMYKKPGKVVNIIRMARHVLAGNYYLADFALRYNPSISVIPTPIDTNKYFPSGEKNNKELIIGWVGSITTLDFLNAMSSVFVRLSQRFAHIKFKIVGGEFFVSGLSNIISKQWSLREEVEDLRSFDIGIMPMPDNEWTRGKCGFKAILYMSIGIPCVCSPVGMNKEIIANGTNGFFAQTEEDWIERLALLIEDSDLRKKIGLEAKRTVEEKYSLSLYADRFLEVLQSSYR